MRKLTVFAALIVSGCVSSQYQQVRLDDIFIADGTTVIPYTKAVKLTPPGATTQTLPMSGNINIGMLVKPENQWLHAFNFDGDNFLDEGEITHGWLVKTAQLLTGKAYAADSLRLIGKSAASPIRQGAMASLHGAQLSQRDQRRIRASLDATNSQKIAILLRSIETIIEDAEEMDAGGGGGY